jgi:hypothetical protein
MDKKQPTTVFLWVWVVTVMAAYVYQFKGLTRPILNLLGLS